MIWRGCCNNCHRTSEVTGEISESGVCAFCARHGYGPTLRAGVFETEDPDRVKKGPPLYSKEERRQDLNKTLTSDAMQRIARDMRYQ